MRSHRRTDVVSRLDRFEDRVKELGDGVHVFFVVSNNGKGRVFPEGLNDNPLPQLKRLIEVEGWREVGLFAIALGECGNELSEPRMNIGTPAIRIERYLYERPPSVEDQQLFAEALSEVVRRLGKEEEQW